MTNTECTAHRNMRRITNPAFEYLDDDALAEYFADCDETCPLHESDDCD